MLRLHTTCLLLYFHHTQHKLITGDGSDTAQAGDSAGLHRVPEAWWPQRQVHLQEPGEPAGGTAEQQDPVGARVCTKGPQVPIVHPEWVLQEVRDVYLHLASSLLIVLIIIVVIILSRLFLNWVSTLFFFNCM